MNKEELMKQHDLTRTQVAILLAAYPGGCSQTGPLDEASYKHVMIEAVSDSSETDYLCAKRLLFAHGAFEFKLDRTVAGFNLVQLLRRAE